MLIEPVDVPDFLRPWVEEIYRLERGGDSTDHPSIADVRSGIFIQSDASDFAVVYDGQVLDRSFVWGPSSYPKTTRLEGNINALVLILKPLALYSAFGLNTPNMLDKAIYIDDWISGFSDTLKKLRTSVEILAAVHEQLFITNRPTRVDGRAWHVIQNLHSDRNAASIQNICDRMGMTERNLERKTKLMTGLSPKTFRNISRFQYIYRDLSTEKPSLARLAYNYDFADQSHLTREFKRYAGFIPSKIDRFKKDVI